MSVMRDTLHTCHYIRTLQVTCFMTAVVKHVAHMFLGTDAASVGPFQLIGWFCRKGEHGCLTC